MPCRGHDLEELREALGEVCVCANSLRLKLWNIDRVDFYKEPHLRKIRNEIWQVENDISKVVWLFPRLVEQIKKKYLT